VSGLWQLYGNANWHSSGGAGASTNGADGYIEVTPSPAISAAPLWFADFDNGQMIKAFTFEADCAHWQLVVPLRQMAFSISYVRANDPVLADVASGGNPATDNNIWADGTQL
jgi:hypothetical protein